MCENNNCEGLQDVLCTIIKLQKQGKCLDEGISPNTCDKIGCFIIFSQ